MPNLIALTKVALYLGARLLTIYQEALHTMRTRRTGKGIMTIKIDLGKAYEKLSWTFIRDTLDKTGFPDPSYLDPQLESTRFSIAWNGKNLESFRPTRGVRQGHHLPPPFRSLLGKIRPPNTGCHRLKEMETIQLSRNGPPLSHLFFADDLKLFAEASEGQMEIILDCLNRFCEASGQNISCGKSNICFSRNVTEEDLARTIASLADIPLSKNVGNYLRTSSINGRAGPRLYQQLIDKVAARLEGWKMKFLTLAGRYVLPNRSSVPSLSTTCNPLHCQEEYATN